MRLAGQIGQIAGRRSRVACVAEIAGETVAVVVEAGIVAAAAKTRAIAVAERTNSVVRRIVALVRVRLPRRSVVGGETIAATELARRAVRLLTALAGTELLRTAGAG